MKYKIFDSIIDKLESCHKNWEVYVNCGEECVEESVEETYRIAKGELKLLINELGLQGNDIAIECPVLIYDINLNMSQAVVKQSITFVKAMKNYFVNYDEETKKEIKKYKKGFEVTAGLPFLKGKYSIKEE